ncbi:hypothetical protein EGY17_00840 (plasmid) [Escherichia coli]|nr:hypothetical protein EGY17_00840 [Escherichia coli]POR92401.1 hypothetical protein CQA91_28150 [Shigella flexneri]
MLTESTYKGLSGVRGNSHAPFLGGGGAAMCRCYPTCDRKSLNVLFYIDKTSYPISCSLPGQALPATAGSEAPGTTRAGRQPG